MNATLTTLTTALEEVARPVELVTLARCLPADLDTPVSVYLRLAGQGPSFMLESVSGGEQLARYSFIGVLPSKAYVLRGQRLEIHLLGHPSENTVMEVQLPDGQSPIGALRQLLAAYHYTPQPGLPRFAGGLVGYLGYETTRFYEPALNLGEHPTYPDAIFLHTDTLVAFDHAYGQLLLIASAPVQTSEEDARADVNHRLDMLEEKIAAPLPPTPRPPFTPPVKASPEGAPPMRSNMTKEAFMGAVETAKEHIAAGDIFQVVLSQRFARETTATPFSIYRALRRLNPSPYMFYFDFELLANGGKKPFHLIGASPEMHARLENQVAAIRPIAGTRPRGKTQGEDQAMERDLLADPKECAEHVMLVDLARNDLGRVCEFGSVHVPEKMVVERYSHVMHIVSHVEGQLREEYDGFDLMAASFPAGTVSGAPKIRAMQIIQDLEGDARGPYAGAVGYFSYDGSSDTCIAIRTLVMHGETVSLQAGAGIVADSDPEKEYQETINKARALAVAIETAEQAQ